MDSTVDIFVKYQQHNCQRGNVRPNKIQNKEILTNSKDTYCFQQM